MKRFEVLTLFPDIFSSYLKESLIYKAQQKGLIKIRIHNLRDWSNDPHKKVDDRPFGGGTGMVIKVEPIYRAVKDLKRGMGRKKGRVILFTPRGSKFTQKIGFQLSKLDYFIFICGRYEGVDERVAKYVADMTLSIGDYDLMGGELPALVVIETICRLIPGVLGKFELLKERITKKGGFIEYAQYTRPAVFQPRKGIKWKVPPVLLSGDHKKIEKWRAEHSKIIE